MVGSQDQSKASVSLRSGNNRLDFSHDQFIHLLFLAAVVAHICASVIAKMASSCGDNGTPDWLKPIAEDCQNILSIQLLGI